MNRSSALPFAMGAIALALVQAATTAWLGSPIRAQTPNTPPPRPVPAVTATSTPRAQESSPPLTAAAWEHQEMLTRAREDVELAELRLSVRRTLLREAELTLQMQQELRDDTERIRRKGLASSLSQKRAELELIRSQGLYEMRKTEVAEAEKAYDQARRRLAFLQQSAQAGAEPDSDPTLLDHENRIRRLEEQVVILQANLPGRANSPQEKTSKR
jgi:hypothetical protein